MSFLRANYQLLAGLCGLLFLLLCRILWTGTLHFGFLIWNLFLAVLPLVFSYYAVRTQSRMRALLLSALWLLFFPNAAYLLTDLVHLKHHNSSLYWLDLALLFAAGAYGVTLGFLSLQMMEAAFTRNMSPPFRTAAVFGLLLLCGYGMYLGRVERWNSWDAVARPFDLLGIICYEARHPFRCREAWMMSGVFGSALQLLYLLPRKTGSDRRAA